MSKILNKQIHTNDLALLEIPKTLFNPHRIIIMKSLALHSQVEFRELKHSLKISDGNLASHLRALIKMGYIQYDKRIIGKKPRTTYEITIKGMKMYDKFKKYVSGVLKE